MQLDKKLVDCLEIQKTLDAPAKQLVARPDESVRTGAGTDADTSCQIEKQILTDEIQDPEFLNFAVENISELFGYLATGRVNIRIHRDFTG